MYRRGVREHDLLTKFLIPGRPVRREVVVPPGSACLNRALGLARNISNDMTPAAGLTPTLRFRAGDEVEVRPSASTVLAGIVVESPSIVYKGDVDARSWQMQGEG